MITFKQFMVELSQVQHSDLYNALAGKIKLDGNNASAIFPKAGEKSVFKHITDAEGTMFLIKNKDPRISVSAEKFGKRYTGIETNGTHLVIADGRYITWSPIDATTSVGDRGIRWQGIARDKEPFPQEFKDDYFKGIIKIVKNDPIFDMLKDVVNKEGSHIIKYLNPVSFSKWNDSFTSDDPNSNAYEKQFEDKLKDYRTQNPKATQTLEDKLFKHQRAMIKKHGANIRNILEDEWKKKAFHVRGRMINYDEAVIDHVKVTKVILTGLMQSALIGAIRNPSKMHNNPYYTQLKNRITELKSVGYKGLISMMDSSYKFRDIKKVMNDKSLADNINIVLKDLGLVHDTGVMFKLK
jgi:hypothetical protein